MTNSLWNWLILAQAQQQAATEDDSWGLLLKVVVILAIVFGAPAVVGYTLARLLRMREYGFKFSIVLCTAVLGLIPFGWQISQGNSWTDCVALGIDLAGGTNLVYQIDHEKAKLEGKTVTPEMVDQMVGAIAKRLDPAGTQQIVVRRVGSDRIEVIIPGADPETTARKKREMQRLGRLEFAILANRRRHADVINAATQLAPEQKELRMGDRVVARWMPVARGPNEKGEVVDKVIDYPGSLTVTRSVKVDGKDVTEFLVYFEREADRVTGRYLTRAFRTLDDRGLPAVGFTFNSRGGTLFSTLTTNYRPEGDFKHRLAVLLDEQIHSAPSINAIIGSNGIIEGSFTETEILELINVLNAGALEAPLKESPISEQTISPLLGADMIQKGMTALWIASAAVAIFMLVYYLFAGLVADVCLVLNIILIMGSMALINGTFTLPGLAGIVLTIGMAVDANVLIYERMREELGRGASLRMAIHNGFAKAFITILDSNLTTFITGLILYMIGTDAVKGFAVTLIIGLIMSMYTALFVGRILFDVVEKKRWLTSLKMFSFVGKTDIDFLAPRKLCLVGSVVLILVGLVAVGARGQDNLDIDFTGGTMITFQLDDDPAKVDIGDVRQPLEQEFGAAVTVEGFPLAETDANKKMVGQLFRLRTKLDDIDQVRDGISQSLAAAGFTLHRVKLEAGEIKPIAEIGGGEGAAQPNVEFAGGHEVELSFGDELHTSTAEQYFIEQLSKITVEEGRPKYDRPESLLRIEGTEGSGLTAAAGKVRQFSKMKLSTSPVIAAADLKAALSAMQKTMSDNPIFMELNTFASAVGREMQGWAILAMLLSLVAIVVYVWFRFARLAFGVAAVAALAHDVLVPLGMLALCSYAANYSWGRALGFTDFKINLEMIAAFLTIVGYSINDTIVIFDRIREVRGKNPAVTVKMINDSLNQTLSRTILTSLTVFMVVFTLYTFGGGGIHGFAFCMLVGLISGTYSTIYIASPVLVWMLARSGEGDEAHARAMARRQQRASAV